MARQAAAAWKQQYEQQPDTLQAKEKRAYEQDPGSLTKTILDVDSPYADYREAWIGAFKQGQDVPMARSFDEGLRGTGSHYQSPFDSLATAAAEPSPTAEPTAGGNPEPSALDLDTVNRAEAIDDDMLQPTDEARGGDQPFDLGPPIEATFDQPDEEPIDTEPDYDTDDTSVDEGDYGGDFQSDDEYVDEEF